MDRRKVVEYLLSPRHSSGRSKARFFIGVGFSAEQWQALASALQQQAAGGKVIVTERNAFGKKCVVEGPLLCPDDRERTIRSIWFVATGQSNPRLVTAYPAGERQ